MGGVVGIGSANVSSVYMGAACLPVNLCLRTIETGHASLVCEDEDTSGTLHGSDGEAEDVAVPGVDFPTGWGQIAVESSRGDPIVTGDTSSSVPVFSDMQCMKSSSERSVWRGSSHSSQADSHPNMSLSISGLSKLKCGGVAGAVAVARTGNRA